MFTKFMAISLLMILALSAALRINGEDAFIWGYSMSTQFGLFYTDGVLNTAVQEPEGTSVFAYYKMDDYAASYTVLDSSGNNRHATIGETTDTLSAPGLVDSSLLVNNFSGGLLVNESIPQIMAGDFTAAVWLYIEAGNSAMMNTAIFFTPESQNYTRAYINNNGTLNVAFGDNYTEYPVNVVSAWHHIVFVKNGNSYNIYYDGAFIAAQGIGPYYSTDWTWFDGAMSDWLSPRIDELIFYDKALTPSQVTDLFASYDGPDFGTITYDVGYYTSDMELPGACTIEYSSKLYLEGTEIGAFPTITSNDPRYSFASWVYAGQGDYLYETSPVYDGLTAAANWITVSPASALYFDSQGGSQVSEWWELYEGFTFEIPYFGNFFPADPTYEGYMFAGWFNGAEGTGYPITAQGVYDSITFGTGYMYAFAYWTLPPITFTFTSGVPATGWGTAQTDIPGIENYVTYDYTESTYGAGAEITALPSASVTGPRYTFAGYWYDPYYSVVYQAGSFAPTSIYPYEGSFPLFSMWDDGGFEGTLAFDSMDGTPVTLTKNLFDGSDFGTGDFGELSWPENPTRPGYVFDGWNTQADGQGLAGVTYATQYVIAYGTTVTLYAMWVAE